MDNDFIIYPNPAKNFIEIQSPMMRHQDLQFSLSNAHGKILLQQDSRNSNILSLEALSPGVYMLTIENGMIKKTYKIIKE